MKILIVEDEFTGRFGLQILLKRIAQIELAVNGEEAVEKFIKGYENNAPFDLVLLDIMLPGISGQEALKKMREYEINRNIIDYEDRVKIVMVTALSDYDNIKNSYQSICDDYIFKPVEKEKLYEKLVEMNFIEGDSDG